MGMGEIRVPRFTWTVQTCRWGQTGRRGQADFLFLPCRVGVEYGDKVTSRTVSVWQNVETVSKTCLNRENVDKVR